MAGIQILEKPIEIEFRQGEGAEAAPDEDAILAGVEAMAALINSKPWPDELARAYTGLEKIVFFTGAVEVNGTMLSRPGIDEAEATFYWTEAEFNQNDDDGHANTLFHDGWHVIQFEADGYAYEKEERIDREVAATKKQIEAAKILGSSDDNIAELVAYSEDRDEIWDRIKQGVD